MSEESKLANALQGAANLVEAFTQFVNNDAIKNLAMPNIPFPTMGGHVFWSDLAKVKGWRLQKNMFTGHCRILDPDDVRRAWGGESALLKMLHDLARS